MNETSFIDKVKKYFSYLETEYAFNVISTNNSATRPFTDGAIKYASKSTLILIDSEMGFVTIRLARLQDGEKYYLTPIDIYEYLNTTEQQQKLLLSTNQSDQLLAAALFNEKFLLNQPEWKGSQGTAQDLEKELSNFSIWLKTHANICLEGDFSKWPELYEYKILRARADHLRRGKDELGYARVKDVDGNWKLVKQSIFKDKLDHAEKLKREFSKSA